MSFVDSFENAFHIWEIFSCFYCFVVDIEKSTYIKQIWINLILCKQYLTFLTHNEREICIKKGDDRIFPNFWNVWLVAHLGNHFLNWIWKKLAKIKIFNIYWFGVSRRLSGLSHVSILILIFLISIVNVSAS